MLNDKPALHWNDKPDLLSTPDPTSTVYALQMAIDGVYEELVDIDRGEYIALKVYLAKRRGYAAPAEGEAPHGTG